MGITAVHGFIQENLGLAYRGLKKSKEAFDCFTKALKIFNELELWEEAGDASTELVKEYQSPSDIDKIKRYLHRAFEYYTRGNNAKKRAALGEILSRFGLEK